MSASHIHPVCILSAPRHRRPVSPCTRPTSGRGRGTPARLMDAHVRQACVRRRDLFGGEPWRPPLALARASREDPAPARVRRAAAAARSVVCVAHRAPFTKRTPCHCVNDLDHLEKIFTTLYHPARRGPRAAPAPSRAARRPGPRRLVTGTGPLRLRPEPDGCRRVRLRPEGAGGARYPMTIVRFWLHGVDHNQASCAS